MTTAEITVTDVADFPATLIVDVAAAWEMATLEASYRSALARSERMRDEWQRQFQAQNQAAVNAAAELENFRKTVAEAIMAEAIKRNWCDDAEEFLDDLGLIDYVTSDVTVRVSFDITVRRTGRDIDQDDVDSAAIDYIRREMGFDDWEVLED